MSRGQISSKDIKLLNDVDLGIHWRASEPNDLSVRIPVTERDQTAALHSLECHKSQFSLSGFENGSARGSRSLFKYRPARFANGEVGDTLRNHLGSSNNA
jgi:hypothetical protein